MWFNVQIVLTQDWRTSGFQSFIQKALAYGGYNSRLGPINPADVCTAKHPFIAEAYIADIMILVIHAGTTNGL